MAGEVRVHGLADLNRALRRTSKDVRLGVRKELRSVAEPVRLEAETLARSGIRNIGLEWSRMKTGQTVNAVYVAPKQRGARGKSRSRRRPNLKTLLLDRAMEPALEHHKDEIADGFGQMIDRVADNFSR